MKFCEDHWLRLRAEIDVLGLTQFVAKDGKTAVRQLATDLQRQATGKDTFDPLMAAHWAIATNVMEMLAKAGYNPLYLLRGDPPPGRNDCPLCEINFLHQESCTDPKCNLDKERGYDWMLKRAAEESLETAREYGLVPVGDQ